MVSTATVTKMSCTMTRMLPWVVSSTSGNHADVIAENGNADEIDLVLSHSRHEEHSADEKDLPQVNLVS